ncbi:MAG: hypothetical protein ACE5GD_05265 [Candidatus Geothermarchaeales archaeon]
MFYPSALIPHLLADVALYYGWVFRQNLWVINPDPRRHSEYRRHRGEVELVFIHPFQAIFLRDFSTPHANDIDSNVYRMPTPQEGLGNLPLQSVPVSLPDDPFEQVPRSPPSPIYDGGVEIHGNYGCAFHDQDVAVGGIEPSILHLFS